MAGLKDVTIKQKLIGLSSIVLFALVAIVASTTYQMGQIRDELINIAEDNIPMTELVTETVMKQLEQSLDFERAVRYGMVRNTANSDNPPRYESIRDHFFKLHDEVENLMQQINVRIKELEAHAYDQADLDTLLDLDEQFKEIKTKYTEYGNHATEVFQTLEKNDLQQAEALALSVEHQEDQLNAQIEQLLVRMGKFTEASAVRAELHEEQALHTLLTLSGFILITVIVMSVMINRSISEKIRLVRDAVAEIANNLDLTKRVGMTSKDELGELSTDLDHLLNNLLSSVTSVVNASTQLAAASEELSTISIQNNQTVARQYSATDDVAEAIQQLSDSSTEVATIALQASAAADSADQATRNGLSVVRDNLSAMRRLQGEVEQATHTISQLNDNAKNISSVLDVIQAVAEQTNLLALNAAIEAARAGEAGRGFSVVADEVRELANRTHKSTGEIRHLIENLQHGSADAEEIMQRSQTSANEVADQAESADGALEVIAQAVNEINAFSQQIAQSAEEQSAVANQINENIMEIRSSAQESSETTRQTTESSEALSELASTLQSTGTQFKIS